MTIGINGNEANVEHRVGSGQYAFELISHLSKIKSPNTKFKVYLSAPPRTDLPSISDSWSYQVLGTKRLWTLTVLQRALISEKKQGTAPNVFFTPSHYSPLFMPTPSVISIMDLAFLRFPGYFKKKDYYQLKLWTKRSASHAAKILTISEFSKGEICSLYGIKAEKVVVTYPGYDSLHFNHEVKNQKSKIKSTIQKYKIHRPYFLFLGTVQPRKNLLRLIEAFYQLRTENYQLVVVGMINEGRGGWMYEEIFTKVKKLGLEGQVVFTGYVPQEEVPYLMAKAKAYVLPSLYEGFGIPPVEAMATGVPIAVSRVSSMPEICGEAAIYIEDPYSVDSIRVSLQKVLDMKDDEKTKRINLGLKWIKRYNWETTALKTLEVLKAVADVSSNV